jgi:GMP synthase (glutamine-hydrolysing)
MALRFLLVDGNTREARDTHVRDFGKTSSAAYADVLKAIERNLHTEVVCPADEGCDLPDADGLEGFDAVVLTGSALNIYQGGPSIERQIELMRAVYRAGVPAFGSCWGLQVATVAAGGEVRRNERGAEIGFARNIAPTEAGRSHPLLAGRPPAYTAPAVHIDAVCTPAPGTEVLATNPMSPVQAAEISFEGGRFWGVQYHPELDLHELATILRRYAHHLVEVGYCRDEGEAKLFAERLEALHREPGRRDLAWRLGVDAEVIEPARRRSEIRAFIEQRVKREASARGRM